MTTAVSEILQQVEFLSPTEQLELTAKLAERAQQNATPAPHNGSPAFEAELPAPSEAAADDEDWLESLDVFDLKRMPPEDSFVVRMRFVEAGMGEPLRYDFSGIFNDEGDDAEGR